MEPEESDVQESGTPPTPGEPAPKSGILGSKHLTEQQRADLIDTFINSVQERVTQLELGLKQTDASLLAESLHALHGSASLFGFGDIASAVRRVEDLMREKADFEQVQATARGLLDLCRKIVQTYRAR